MSGISGVTPIPVTVIHDPLGREMTEEQKARLREQLSAPVEEVPHKERVEDRRREGAPGREQDQGKDDDEGPGQIIDSYA
jgi:hypothetical protein